MKIEEISNVLTLCAFVIQVCVLGVKWVVADKGEEIFLESITPNCK